MDIDSQAWASDTSMFWGWDSTVLWEFDSLSYDDTTWINPLYRGVGQGPIGYQQLAEFGIAGQASTSYEKRYTWRDSYKGSITLQKGSHELKAGFDVAKSKIRYYRMGRASSTSYYFANNKPFSPTQDIYTYTTDSTGIVTKTQGADGAPDYTQDGTDTWKNTDYNSDSIVNYDDYMDDYIFQAYSSGYAENIGYDITGRTEINEGKDKYREPVTSAFYVRDKVELEDLVLNLAKNSSEADGFIASGKESKLLRENFPKHLIFAPGIRMPGDDRHEQKRVVSPAEALKYSDLIIMGRSLMNGDIKKNLSRVITSLKM